MNERSVQCCTSDRCVCVCVCVRVCARVCARACVRVRACVVVGWGSEFSDSWGKRGEGGQGREGVQLPDSLVDEAVFQSVCPGLETPQSPP